jgi:phosphohistidine phosphatase
VKRLFLVRHAKAVPAARDADDHARRLAEQGRADAALMAGYIKRKNYRPDLVLCSDSARTRETLEIGRAITEMQPCVDYRGDLYLAEPSLLLAVLREVPDRANSVMLVGHNPGLEQIVSMLLKHDQNDPHHYRSALEEKFPTAAFAVLDFDIADWTQLAEGSGALADFKTPKDLKA